MSYLPNASDHVVLDKISSLLTPEQVLKFIQKSVPELKSIQISLQQSLELRQWEDAARQAHRLKSAISLLSANSLVISLDLIESGDSVMIESCKFKASLMIQFQQLIDDLESYLGNSNQD